MTENIRTPSCGNYRDVAEHEEGNALFLILIAVVLFAALSYAITQSNRGGSGVTKETSSLAASSIMNYMSGIRTGFMRLSLRGHGGLGEFWDGDIYMTSARDSVNYNDDTRQTNNIFHPDGGGVSYMDASPDWVNEVDTTESTGNVLLAGKAVKGVGAADQENVIIMYDIKEKVCERLNFMLTGKEDIPVLDRTEYELITSGNKIEDAGDVTLGQTAYCVGVSDTDKYYFYYVAGEDTAGTSPW